MQPQQLQDLQMVLLLLVLASMELETPAAQQQRRQQRRTSSNKNKVHRRLTLSITSGHGSRCQLLRHMQSPKQSVHSQQAELMLQVSVVYCQRLRTKHECVSATQQHVMPLHYAAL